MATSSFLNRLGHCCPITHGDMSKTIFIMGTWSGLGETTTLLFQEKGWHIIAPLGNPEQTRELVNVTILPVDVNDVEQIKQTVSKAIGSGFIDVVIINTGYGLSGPLEATSGKHRSVKLLIN